MFASYLIDPLAHSVETVRDGVERAASLIESDRLEIATLWTGPLDPDASIDIVFAEDGFLQKPLSDSFFRLRFVIGGKVTERIVAGKAVLGAFGEVPDDIAGQVRTLPAMEGAIDFIDDAALALERAPSTPQGGVLQWNDAQTRGASRRSERTAARSNRKTLVYLTCTVVKPQTPPGLTNLTEKSG
ncbi:hypothetical protein [Paraburkholderia sp. RL17-337-BIB-A]|uniref:hypothetical protein n=1 Tax=Paraburkholderia sp. RL17-337-BIB-A TaxID=3031636 RepID=UPI0038BAF436